jgi:hypothetical protein
MVSIATGAGASDDAGKDESAGSCGSAEIFAGPDDEGPPDFARGCGLGFQRISHRTAAQNTVTNTMPNKRERLRMEISKNDRPFGMLGLQTQLAGLGAHFHVLERQRS